MDIIQNTLNGSMTIIAVILLILIAIKLYIIVCIGRTAKNTEELIRVMADIEHNNQVRHKEIIEELRRIKEMK